MTLGLASQITPMTPNGTLTFLSLSPLVRVLSSRTFPSGSGREATLRMSDAMVEILSSVSFRRSYRGLLLSIKDRSSAFAASNARAFRSREDATLRRASFLCPQDRWRMARPAVFAFSNTGFIILLQIVYGELSPDFQSSRKARFHAFHRRWQQVFRRRLSEWLYCFWWPFHRARNCFWMSR